MTDVTINAADGGTFTGYLAKPASGTGPGIVVAQEIFGVNHVMRDLCDNLAAQGYFALCPDLFWRQEPGIQITDKTDAEWAKAFELYKGFSEVKGVDDLISSLNYLRDVEGCNGSVGTLGYCLGGKLAYLMATRSNADCSVSYYGVGIEKNLDEASAITKPYLAHVAEKDQFVPPEVPAADPRSVVQGQPRRRLLLSRLRPCLRPRRRRALRQGIGGPRQSADGRFPGGTPEGLIGGLNQENRRVGQDGSCDQVSSAGWTRSPEVGGDRGR